MNDLPILMQFDQRFAKAGAAKRASEKVETKTVSVRFIVEHSKVRISFLGRVSASPMPLFWGNPKDALHPIWARALQLYSLCRIWTVDENGQFASVARADTQLQST
jgi:hypothetical protein